MRPEKRLVWKADADFAYCDSECNPQGGTVRLEFDHEPTGEEKIAALVKAADAEVAKRGDKHPDLPGPVITRIGYTRERRKL